MRDKPAKPDYDQSLKRMLLRSHDGFLALVAPDLTWRGELASELPAAARRADLVWEVEDRAGQRGILHVELQTKADHDIGERVAEYGIRLWLRDHLPVRSLVIFLRPAASTPESPFTMQWSGDERLRYVYDTIHLWEIDPKRVLETDQYSLWPLAGLMANVTPESILSVAEKIASAPLPTHERGELTGTLVLLAGVRLRSQDVLEALRRQQVIDDILKESSFTEVMRVLLAPEYARTHARIALEGRFGAPLDEQILAALDNAEEDVCEAILAHVSTDTLDDVRARLGITQQQ